MIYSFDLAIKTIRNLLFWEGVRVSSETMPFLSFFFSSCLLFGISYHLLIIYYHSKKSMSLFHGLLTFFSAVSFSFEIIIRK